VDIILHCVDHNHLKQRPLHEVFPPVQTFHQVMISKNFGHRNLDPDSTKKGIWIRVNIDPRVLLSCQQSGLVGIQRNVEADPCSYPGFLPNLYPAGDCIQHNFHSTFNYTKIASCPLFFFGLFIALLD
jgi:hypothetical protein